MDPSEVVYLVVMKAVELVDYFPALEFGCVLADSMVYYLAELSDKSKVFNWADGTVSRMVESMAGTMPGKKVRHWDFPKVLL